MTGWDGSSTLVEYRPSRTRIKPSFEEYSRFPLPRATGKTKTQTLFGASKKMLRKGEQTKRRNKCVFFQRCEDTKNDSFIQGGSSTA
jgi:hypothetical protein